LGADRAVLSNGSAAPNSWAQAGPNTYDVFAARWGHPGPPSSSPPSPAAPIFQGIDWSGNVAVTSSTGKFSMSDMDVYADIGVHCGATPCNQSVSNTNWFPDQQLSPAGTMPGVGVTAFNSAPLLSELAAWKSFIQGLTAEATITSDIENQNSIDGSGPFVTNLDALDTNNDGLVVIDINRGGSDFKVNNSDWILQGSQTKSAIFRVRGGTNMLIDNSSILLGDDGIGTHTDSGLPDGLGAIFFKGDEEGSGSSDKVFSGNNVILNGIGLWDLVTVGENGTTQLGINNGQGCAQFISSSIDFNDVRWNRCSDPQPVPEPSTLLSLVAAFVIMTIGVRSRSR
jgi:hypothetical protein